MYGLVKDGEIKEVIVKKDENTAIRYTVKVEGISLGKLKQEKTSIEAELEMKEPTNEELIGEGKASHRYYFVNKTELQERLEEINKVLEA